MSFQHTEEQEAAIAKVVNWLDNYEFQSQQVMRMIGPAGAGKTTIMKAIAARTKRRTRFAAFAGKAALVLASKGCTGAETLHKLLYEPRGQSVKHYREELAILEKLTNPAEIKMQESKLASLRDAMSTPGFIKRLPSEFHPRTAFSFDEVSMVDKFIGMDAESYGFPILAVGDPFQLPPVMGTGWFFPKGFKADIELVAVHRQAEGSAVLKMATHIRKGGRIQYGQFADSACVPKMTIPEYAAFDQILCGTNKNRISLNQHIRKHLGRKKWLEPGERLICSQNNYEVGVMNGSQWTVLECEPATRKDKQFYKARIQSIDNPNEVLTVYIHLNPLMEGTKSQDQYWTPMLANVPEALCMQYGYAITVHKSQGSQWDSVVVHDDWTGTSYQEWLYTAVTRAAKRVTIVRPIRQ